MVIGVAGNLIRVNADSRGKRFKGTLCELTATGAPTVAVQVRVRVIKLLACRHWPA